MLILTYDGAADIKLSVQVSLQESAGVTTVIFKTVCNGILSLLGCSGRGTIASVFWEEVRALWMAD